MSRSRPAVTIGQGTLRGVFEGGVVAVRNVPYAASPVGELRFRPPGVHPGWHGIRDAATSGPSVPQGLSRLENVMGPAPADSDEDGCLNLNVWTPEAALTDGRRRPVLVWIHGGGWTSGAGGWDWYDGGRFAAGGDVVVVTINYRLAAFGWLWLPEVGAGNLGAQDQAAALRWVRDNVSAFGGDPAAVTVGGQSAGAYSALSLALDPTTRPLVDKVIAQSGPWAVAPQPPSAATKVAGDYLDLLDVSRGDGLRDELRRVPVADLVAAYAELSPSPDAGSVVAPPMYPVLGGAGVPQPWRAGIDRDGLRGVPLLVGSTDDEMTAFGARGSDADRATRTEFGDGVEWLAQSRSARGQPAWVYRFGRTSTSTPALGATHCSDLPFAFDHLDAYAGAPMTGPVDGSDRRLADELSAAIAEFVRTGRADECGWPPYEPAEGGHVERFIRGRG